MLEHGAVGAHGGGHRLPGGPGRVLEGHVVGLKVVAIDLGCFSEEGPSTGLRILRRRNHHITGILAETEQGDARSVLGNVDALMVDAGNDLDKDPAMGCVGGVVQRLLNRGVVACAGGGTRAVRIHPYVHVLRLAGAHRQEAESRAREAHGETYGKARGRQRHAHDYGSKDGGASAGPFPQEWFGRALR